MNLNKSIQIKNFPIKKFIILIISFQLFVWGSICLEYVGIKIPILRQLVCFIYLSYIPGIVAIRALKLYKIHLIETFLYAVGLSMSILMLVGLFMNTFYPLIGISKPISLIPLIFTLSLIVILLCVLCFKIDDNVSEPSCIELKKIVSVPILLLSLIVPLTVIGTYIMNFYNNNFLLLFVLLLLSSIVVLSIYDIIPENLYAFALIVTSLSLLLHKSLISMYISGWDIQIEYYIANRVISNYLWDPSLVYSSNAMLSIVMLAPIYSIILNTSLVWVFKIIFPLIFSLLPLGLYRLFRMQTTNKIAFISVFFFVSFVGFYTEMIQLARQQIAEYFFMLMMLVMIQNKYKLSSKILLIIFSFSMIVSHYGLSYIVIGSICFISLSVVLYQKFTGVFFRTNIIRINFMLLVLVFLLMWYMNISSSFVLDSIVHIINKIITDFCSDLFNPAKAQGLYEITKHTKTPLHTISRLLHIVTQIFISIGLFYVLFDYLSSKKCRFNNEYLSLSVVFYSMLIAAIIVPNFASSLNTSRVYQIGLILLSPFCVIGGVMIIRSMLENIKIFKTKNVTVTSYRILSLFFAVFLLFNSGWIYEIAKTYPTSESLNNKLDYPKFNDQEVAGKEWLYSTRVIEGNSSHIYADYYRWLLFLNSIESKYLHTLSFDTNDVSKKSYIYISSYNILNNNVLINHRIGINDVLEYVNLDRFISSRNLIYSNGGSKIYYT